MPERKKGGFAWSVAFIVLGVSMAAPLNQFKVPPVLPILMDVFALSPSVAGLLMSIFALTGLFLALPAGFIFQRLGFRKTGVFAITCLVAGSILGLLSMNLGMLLFSRFVEGAGMAFMGVVAPAVLGMWFSAQHRGRAMGIWSIWVPGGATFVFVLAPLILRFGGWRGLWWLGLAYAVAAFVVFAFFLRRPSGNADAPSEGDEHGRLSPRDLGLVLKNRSLWLLALLFACFAFIFVTFMTWMPTFLETVRGRTVHETAFLMTVMQIMMIISGPLGGWVSDRLGSRKVVCIFPMLAAAAALPLASVIDIGLVLLMAAIGLIASPIAVGLIAAAIESTGEHRLAGLATAVVMVGQNAGMLIGPFAFGAIITISGWDAAFWMLSPVAVTGAAAVWLARIR